MQKRRKAFLPNEESSVTSQSSVLWLHETLEDLGLNFREHLTHRDESFTEREEEADKKEIHQGQMSSNTSG